MPPPPLPPSPRWQRRSEARPAEILDAALAEFTAKGFAATRLEAVAARAGVSKATLYLYFPGKEELFKAVVRAVVGAALDSAEALTAPCDLPAGETLIRLIRLMGRRMASPPLAGLPKLIIAEAANFPDIAAFYRQEMIARSFALIRRVIVRGQDSGEFAAGLDADLVVRMVIAPPLTLALWRQSFEPHEPQPIDTAAYLETHAALLLGGLRNPALIPIPEALP